jgi:PA14 domain
MDTIINPSNPLQNPNTEYSSIDKNWNLGSPQQFNRNQYCATDYFGVQWTGKLQPNFTAKHVFRIDKGGDDNVLMYLDGSPVNFTFKDGEWKTDSVTLQSCRLYDIKVVYTEITGDAKCSLLWSNPNAPEATVIPLKNFYPPTVTAADTLGSCLTVAIITRLNPVKPVNMHNPLFSPVAGTQMLVGAWVKESQPCYTGSYANVGIDVVFAGTTVSYKLRPTGNIIEGWQRIEGFITIPANATSMNVGLRSLGNTDVYFDDIRVHPFNANMKSFVYNPSNLRLMSELDENNYASFYEYDDDGTLIRVKKETERGIKTIQETRSALFKQ